MTMVSGHDYVKKRFKSAAKAIAMGASAFAMARPLLEAAHAHADRDQATQAVVDAIDCVIWEPDPSPNSGSVIGTILVMLAVAALAAWIPARRAAKIDPMEAGSRAYHIYLDAGG